MPDLRFRPFGVPDTEEVSDADLTTQETLLAAIGGTGETIAEAVREIGGQFQMGTVGLLTYLQHLTDQLAA